MTTSLYQPKPRLDLLRLPFLGRLLLWRWGRLAFQICLTGVAGLIIYDGLTGPQLAPANSATVLAWVHYRGLVLLALLMVGNLFCFACPFTLPRTLARRLSLSGPRWPRWLRNKWLSIGGLLLIFWLYEWLDLWASPWLTAWVAVAYFLAALLLEALFSDSPFCKYLCPLGAFNFVHSGLSPLQISARDRQVCLECTGKECVRGSPTVAGCGTLLYVPMVQSNMDCILCLDCARSCPYDNVSLSSRNPLREAAETALRPRWDMAFLILAMLAFGLSNAFGMVPPIYEVLGWMRGTLQLKSEAVQLLLLHGAMNVVAPALLLFGGSWLSARLGPGGKTRPVTMAARYAPAFIPLSFGIWLAHYGFHFAIAGLTIVPVLHSFLLDHGIAWFGPQPNWQLAAVLPQDWIFPLQVLAVVAGFVLALAALAKRGLRAEADPGLALAQVLPWAVIATAMAAIGLQLFNLPMEMRGTFQALTGA